LKFDLISFDTAIVVVVPAAVSAVSLNGNDKLIFCIFAAALNSDAFANPFIIKSEKRRRPRESHLTI